VGAAVAFVVGVGEGSAVEVLVGALVAEATRVCVDMGLEVCVGTASCLQAANITMKGTVYHISLNLLLNMLPPLIPGPKVPHLKYYSIILIRFQ
jgi:hypothetical protein